jgi:transcriptional regulator with XRE-family HTH domain
MAPTLQRVIAARLALLNKSAAAASLEAGLGRSAIQNILAGNSEHPRIDTLKKIATVLGVSVDYLTGEAVTPDGRERSAKDLLATWSPVKYRLEAGVFRDPLILQAGSGRLYLKYDEPHFRLNEIDLYEMADNHMEGLNILPGDIISARREFSFLDTAVRLAHGTLLVIQRPLENAPLSEFTLRQVDRSDPASIQLVCRPASGRDVAPIAFSTDHQKTDDFPVGKLKFGLLVEGIALRATREFD